jgi:pyruvate formate lyase activating enzyme
MEAKYYHKLKNHVVQCDLCHHQCVIADGHSGICGVRLNQEGILYTLNYGRTIARHVDPVELGATCIAHGARTMKSHK